jgi:hypothetical protein
MKIPRVEEFLFLDPEPKMGIGIRCKVLCFGLKSECAGGWMTTGQIMLEVFRDDENKHIHCALMRSWW